MQSFAKRVSAVVCFSLFGLGMIWYIMQWTSDDPMFYEEYYTERGFNFLPAFKRFPTTVADHEGTIVYFDFGRNMVVAILTDNKGIDGYLDQLRQSTSSVTLLEGTSDEETVKADRDVLIIFRKHESLRVGIKPGFARECQGNLLHNYYAKHEWTALKEIVRSYDGDRKMTVERFAAEKEGQNGGGSSRQGCSRIRIRP